MISTLLFTLASQAQADDRTIYLKHARPAEEVTMTKVLTCGPTVFEISYTSTKDKTVGSVLARHRGKLIVADKAQAELFDRLSNIGSTAVTCGFDEIPSNVLIMGVDRETDEVDQLYQIGFQPETGFGKVYGPG